MQSKSRVVHGCFALSTDNDVECPFITPCCRVIFLLKFQKIKKIVETLTLTTTISSPIS